MLTAWKERDDHDIVHLTEGVESMIYRGTVKHGVVAFENGSVLPDGTHVKVEPVASVASQAGPSSRTTTWPAGYFEQTFGSISDDTFARPPQGELPPAVDLE
jgi:hypothetical protein